MTILPLFKHPNQCIHRNYFTMRNVKMGDVTFPAQKIQGDPSSQNLDLIYSRVISHIQWCCIDVMGIVWKLLANPVTFRQCLFFIELSPQFARHLKLLFFFFMKNFNPQMCLSQSVNKDKHFKKNNHMPRIWFSFTLFQDDKINEMNMYILCK